MVEELWAVPREGVWLLQTRRSYDGGEWLEWKTIATADTEDEVWTFARAWRKEGFDHAELFTALDDEWQAYETDFFKNER